MEKTQNRPGLWKSAPWLAAYLAAGVALGVRFSGFAFDDAFITYRVARNMASGHGFVYNPAERINAITNPLWAVVLAALHLITGLDFVVLGATVSMIGLLLAAVFLARFLEDDLAGKYLAGLFVLVSPLLVSCMGMETGLMLALVTGGLLAYSRERLTLAGVLFGLAVLTRMDAALPACLVLFHYLLVRRKAPPLRVLAAFAAVLAPWLIFSLAYFGEILPHTLAVKRAQVYAGGHWGGHWMFASALGKYLADFFGGLDLTTLMIAACVVAGAARIFRSITTRGALVIAWAVLHCLAYALFLSAPPYTWYFAPLTIALAVVVGVGAYEIAALSARHALVRRSLPAVGVGGILLFAGTALSGFAPWLGRRFTPLHAWHLLAYLSLFGTYLLTRPEGFRNKRVAQTAVALMLGISAFFPRAWNGLLKISHLPTTQYAYYRAAADWINAERPHAGSVGAHEIGVLGYYLADKVIVDQCGIPTPGAAKRLAKGDMTWWIERYRPDLLVLHPAREWWVAVEDPIIEAPWFDEAYRPAALLAGFSESGRVEVFSAEEAAKAMEAGRAESQPVGGGPAGKGFDKHAVVIWELVDPALIPAPDG